MGVTSVGLTWNYANMVADGVLEKRGGGITRFGTDVVGFIECAARYGDVFPTYPNLAFWDTIEIADFPDCFSFERLSFMPTSK